MSTLLEEIAKRIKEHDDKEKEKLEKARPKPFVLTTYELPQFVIPKTRDKKQINEFRKILTFIKLKAQALRQKGVCTVMPIPSTSKDLKMIWSNVFRGRELMIKIGLIKNFSDDYRAHGRFSYSKLYMYFYENEVKFIEYCKKNKIEVLDISIRKNKKTSKKVVKTKKEHKPKVINPSKVRIGKRLYLDKPLDMSCPEFESFLFELFKKNYPEYDKYLNMVNEINKYYLEKPEFIIKFRPSFHWNKDFTRVMNIGFRATNEDCNKKSKTERPIILEKNNLVLESDVNASVPRLNHSMNLGHWDSDPRDMYEIIFHHCYPNEVFTESIRDAMKVLLLRGYFDESVDTLKRNIWNYIDHEGLNHFQVDAEIELFREAIEKSCGPKIYGGEIYYIEACVYLSVIKELLDSGHFVWFLYDGLYATGPMIGELFEDLVNRIIEVRFNEFYEEYISNREIKL